MRKRYPSDLSNAEWTRLQPCLPTPKAEGRPRTHSLRDVLDAIFYVVKSGCHWRLLPHDFPPWSTVYYHFRKLCLSGVWALIYRALRSEVDLFLDAVFPWLLSLLAEKRHYERFGKFRDAQCLEIRHYDYTTSRTPFFSHTPLPHPGVTIENGPAAPAFLNPSRQKVGCLVLLAAGLLLIRRRGFAAQLFLLPRSGSTTHLLVGRRMGFAAPLLLICLRSLAVGLRQPGFSAHLLAKPQTSSALALLLLLRRRTGLTACRVAMS